MSCINQLFFCIIFALSMFCAIQLAIAAKNETERSALYEIKAKISDPLGVMNSWNDTHHYCEWHGVRCAHRYEGVTTIDLCHSSLKGTLSSYIGNLSFLRELRLDNNSFHGTIPPEISRLHNLETLLLSNNLFGGEIPSNISSCYKLVDMNLIYNKFVGRIPPTIGLLSNLEFVSFSGNNFTGNIPSSLGNLSSLSSLYLKQNNFVGKISESMGKLRNLTILSLEDNKFSGIVPLSIFNLSLLTELYLRKNELQGELPSNLGRSLPHLKTLSIGSNRFTGHIPSSISNLSNLETIQLNDNNFHGHVPSLGKLVRLSHLVVSNNSLGYNQTGDLKFVASLANATKLEWMEIDRNNFKGVFPQIICNFSYLTYLVIYDNHIGGEIPICIEKLAKLQNFIANDILLSGVIPWSIGKLPNLYDLRLHNNQLSGVIPESIGNLSRLSTFSLEHNRLSGQIPSSIGNCTSLTSVYFQNNSLSGKIPLQVFSLASLTEVVDLSSNYLNGFLPEEVGQLNNLDKLVLTDNMLSGKLPGSLSSCIALEYLYLGRNNFQGNITDALLSLKGLVALDLSYNNFSGEIPKFLASLKLRLLNLSHNNLQGEVPTGGIFDNASSVLVGENSRLCGGIPKLQLPSCGDTQRKGRSTNKRKLTVVILSSFFGITFLLAVCVLFYFLWQRKKIIKESTTLGYLDNFPNLSYQTLFHATNGFSSENLIGSGTFGVVYKGTLEENGKNIAIKIFHLEHQGSLKSFMVECDVLRSIRHRNLLKVITVCSSVDYQGRDFKALVYDYMVNGSLENWLHPTNEISNIESTCNNSRNLSFRQRLDIAVDVAFSLDYLHHHCHTPVVHCDIKPSNVLLDGEMVAHVGDFGIAKILQKGSNYHANQSSSIGVRGTIGYTPPEYGLGNDVSTAGDVYSFGILLLEMFTGKRPTDDMFKGSLSLHYFVMNNVDHEEISSIVDYALLEDIDKEESNMKVILEVITSIFRVALSCTIEVPRERLDIADVATKLLTIRNKLMIVTCMRNNEKLSREDSPMLHY